MADVQTRPVTLTEAVLLRPTMYTMNCTFGEVVCFLEGYYSGIAKTKCDAPPVIEWNDFEDWLADRLCVDSNSSFKAIYLMHHEDCERLKTFADLYARFQAER